MKKRSMAIGWGVCLCACAAFAEIKQEGSAYVGFSQVTVKQGTTILAAPYVNCPDGEAIPVETLVSTEGLTGAESAENADQLIVYTAPTGDQTGLGTYSYYYLNAEKKWTPLTTLTGQIVEDVTSGSGDNAPSALSGIPQPLGNGFWLRKRGDGDATVTLRGRVATNQTTVVSKGLSLIGSGYPTPLDLNSTTMTWPNDVGGDEILIANPGSDTGYDIYRYRENNGTTKWWKVTETTGTENSTFPIATVTLEEINNAIQDGAGFWYRRNGAESFVFNPAPAPAAAQ